MTPQQILLVRNSFAAAEPNRERLTAVFFAELFARQPSLRPLLDGGSARRGAEMFYGLSAIVGSLGRLHPILPAFEWLAIRYARKGVGAAQYRAVEAALLAAFEFGLGDAFTPKLAEAWSAACRIVAGVMLDAIEAEPLAA